MIRAGYQLLLYASWSSPLFTITIWSTIKLWLLTMVLHHNGFPHPSVLDVCNFSLHFSRSQPSNSTTKSCGATHWTNLFGWRWVNANFCLLGCLVVDPWLRIIIIYTINRNYYWAGWSRSNGWPMAVDPRLAVGESGDDHKWCEINRNSRCQVLGMIYG